MPAELNDDERAVLCAVREADGFPRGSRWSGPVAVAKIREKLPVPIGERRLRAALRSLEARNLLATNGRRSAYALHAEGWTMLETLSTLAEGADGAREESGDA